MRKLKDSTEFISKLENKILRWAGEQSQLFRSNVVDSSNLASELTFFDLKNLTLKDHILLSLVSWYIPENHGFILREDLKETSSYLDDTDEQWISLLLESKAQTLIWLIETQLWHERDFFGNILNLKKIEKFLKVRKARTKIVKPKRKRGYHDHGSRVDDHRWLPKYDWSLTKMMNEIEAKRISLLDTRDFIVGMIT